MSIIKHILHYNCINHTDAINSQNSLLKKFPKVWQYSFCIYLIVCILTCRPNQVIAQGYTKEIKQQFIDAEYYLISENYEKALSLYKGVNQFDPTNYNVIYRIGLCYLNSPFSVDKAIPYLEKAITNINPKYNEGSYKETKADPDALFFLGMAYQQKYRFDDAIQVFERYKNLIDVKKLYFINQVNRQIAACRISQELLKAPATVAYKSLGMPINTDKQSNFNPCLSANDSILIYSRSIPHKVYNKETDIQSIKMHNRILMCKRSTNGWSTPVDISMQLKSEGTAIPVSVSSDGKTLYLFRNNEGKDKSHGTMYVSNFSKKRWSPMEKLPGMINTTYNETHASMSSDGKTLYFTSDKKEGSFGGIDIYTIIKINDTTWGQPQNIGDEINTPLNEEAPFVLNDNLLFFSSQGHNTMGGYDLFYSRKTASGWTQPVNMRPPINTPGDELFFVPVLNGNRAYHAVELLDTASKQGNKEIYSFEISLNDFDSDKASHTTQTNKIQAIVTKIPIIGSIETNDNKLLSQATVVIKNANTKQEIERITPDLKTQTYKTELQAGSYVFEIQSISYATSRQVIYISPNTSTNVIIQTVLTPKDMAAGQYFSTRNIIFDAGDTKLSRTNMIDLEKTIAIMEENPSIKAQLSSYISEKTTDNNKTEIARELEDTVLNYMYKRKIELQRIELKGYKKSESLPNGANRMVEIKLIQTDSMKITTTNLAIPDELTYKDFIRYSVLITRQHKALTDEEINKYKTADLPKIELLKVQDQYIYYSGDCKNKAEAVVLLNKVQDAGFADAEITDYFKTNRLTNIQAPSANADHKMKRATDDDLSLDEDISASTPAPTKWYTIQLCALTQPDNSKKKDDKVLIYKCKDGQYRYTWGIYLSMEEAKADLHIATEWGFSDAFVAQGSRYNELECECGR